MAHEIPELDPKGLRDFGLTTGAIVAVLFGLFFPWLLETAIPVWPWVVAGVLALWGLVAPASLRPVYRGWMRIGMRLGLITTPIVLGLVFYIVFAPVGFAFRVFGRDSMARRLDRSTESYRVDSRRSAPRDVERPF